MKDWAWAHIVHVAAHSAITESNELAWHSKPQQPKVCGDNANVIRLIRPEPMSLNATSQKGARALTLGAVHLTLGLQRKANS